MEKKLQSDRGRYKEKWKEISIYISEGDLIRKIERQKERKKGRKEER